MLSHDLARELLARRNNDIRIEVLVDDDPEGERAIWAKRTELRDNDNGGSPYQIPSEQVVSYDSDDDVIVIKANFVVTGQSVD
ncbi:hypothetical protein Ade02nite_19370 [Paractinoplanes deccanensis]|uniref:Uncharacterized protein n=1 Tax=Paractinoplanes deccanensis TaxID=113561 RepID=A0ABQ3XZX0_9ACTN|nr:hypothetical protein [Actinoplanes deccanensis]GID73296.1 hypothetical protein Ade02nite_19370 [Actinoplanes deccanensis]